jgi:hypothetical protein
MVVLWVTTPYSLTGGYWYIEEKFSTSYLSYDLSLFFHQTLITECLGLWQQIPSKC